MRLPGWQVTWPSLLTGPCWCHQGARAGGEEGAGPEASGCLLGAAGRLRALACLHLIVLLRLWSAL